MRITSWKGRGKSMNEREAVESIDRAPMAPRDRAPYARTIGSPLPMGTGRHAQANSPSGNVNRIPPGPPGRALPGAAAREESPSVQRIVNAFRMALPLVQRLMPLLEGNFVTAVTGLLAPHPRPQAPAPPPKVDLAPVEDSLAELQAQHRNLRDQVMEQNNTLKRVEDQLEMVREATDRNTLEQQELLEDLKIFGNKVKAVTFIALGLVAIGFLLNLMLFLHIQRVLP
jgi:hypothetical protein